MKCESVRGLVWGVVLLAVGPRIAAAQETTDVPAMPEVNVVGLPEFDTGDTAWMLTSSALVLMMTAPGLALFYGGLVRKKNILGVMMQCVCLMGLMSAVWALWG